MEQEIKAQDIECVVLVDACARLCVSGFDCLSCSYGQTFDRRSFAILYRQMNSNV